ncbi:MAG: lysine 2,3-aminomutase [Bacteriovoracaceae bacterium]|jgi:lysine 2,3-aminomutase
MFDLNLVGKNAKNNPLPQGLQDSWKKELREAIKTSSALEDILKVKVPKTNYPIMIPKRLALRIYQEGPMSVLWKQFVPRLDEASPLGMEDPIGDHLHSKEGRIIHRYKNRLLFLPTPLCPVICRYCFRKNELSEPDSLFEGQLKETISYLNKHPEVDEVILSGGDPLIMSDEKLESIFKSFASIGTIKYLRIHTRTPIVLPSRVTDSFCDLLMKYGQVFNKLIVAIHLNHIDELDEEVRLSLKKLKNSGVELLSQSVLLKDINDDVQSLKNLFSALVDLGVRPYYLHHPDRVKGGMHFYLSLTEGRMLYHSLRDILPGWSLPQYVIDIPGGHGKTPAYNPEDFDFSGHLISKDGEKHKIPPIQ